MRLRSKTADYLHKRIAEVVILIGFSLIGLTCGILFSGIGSFVGIIYQLLKVLVIFFKVLFNCESNNIDQINDLHVIADSTPV